MTQNGRERKRRGVGDRVGRWGGLSSNGCGVCERYLVGITRKTVDKAGKYLERN